MPILSRATGLAAFMLCSGISWAGTPERVPLADLARDATPATKAVLEQAARDLPPEDGQDFEFAQRGFIATWPEAVIRQANGKPSFDLAGNDFI